MICSHPFFAYAQDKPVAPPLIKQSLNVQSITHQAGIQSQEKIDTISDQQRSLLARYQHLTRQADFQAVYREEMQSQLDQQYLAKQRLLKQIEDVSFTQQQLLPLLRQMLNSLEEFINLDMPFLKNERQQRLAKIHIKLDNPSLNLPQKLQAILEAYQIENDYGRHIEAYKGSLAVNTEQGQEEFIVEFLHIGRIGLYYQTLDGNETGMWDKTSGSWKTLNSQYNHSIRQGFRIAKKQLSPKLLQLPLNAQKGVM